LPGKICGFVEGLAGDIGDVRPIHRLKPSVSLGSTQDALKGASQPGFAPALQVEEILDVID